MIFAVNYHPLVSLHINYTGISNSGRARALMLVKWDVPTSQQARTLLRTQNVYTFWEKWATPVVSTYIGKNFAWIAGRGFQITSYLRLIPVCWGPLGRRDTYDDWRRDFTRLTPKRAAVWQYATCIKIIYICNEIFPLASSIESVLLLFTSFSMSQV